MKKAIFFIALFLIVFQLQAQITDETTPLQWYWLDISSRSPNYFTASQNLNKMQASGDYESLWRALEITTMGPDNVYLDNLMSTATSTPNSPEEKYHVLGALSVVAGLSDTVALLQQNNPSGGSSSFLQTVKDSITTNASGIKNNLQILKTSFPDGVETINNSISKVIPDWKSSGTQTLQQGPRTSAIQPPRTSGSVLFKGSK